MNSQQKPFTALEPLNSSIYERHPFDAQIPVRDYPIAQIPVRDLITNLRKLLAAKFFTSSTMKIKKHLVTKP